MAGWGEVIADIILSSLYIYLLIRLAFAREDYFKTPFYTFFVSTGIYSVIAVVTYQIVVQFPYNEQYWTVYIYKTAFAFNTFGAVGATLGKAFIAIHRYFVMRTRDFAEKKWSRSVIFVLLSVQFVFPLILTGPVWPSSFVYLNGDANGTIVALAPTNTLIMKAISVCTYLAYIIINVIFTVLTSRELLRLRRLIEVPAPVLSVVANVGTTRAIVTQQRNMFIIVISCSLSHLIKAVQQFTIAVCTYFNFDDLYNIIWPMYPLVNGLATYAAPFCLVLLSPNVRTRLLICCRKNSELATNARVTFPHSEVLQGPDIAGTNTASFTCKTQCKVYVDRKSDKLVITQNGIVKTDFSAIVSVQDFAPAGFLLEAGDFVLENRGEVDPKFVLYVVETSAPNYGSPVYAPQETVGAAIKENFRYATVLSSFETIWFTAFTGDFPSGYPRIYTSGFDSANDTQCHPVFQARSQYNAEMSWPMIPSAVFTVDFGFEGTHSVSANQKDLMNPTKGAGESTVFTSPGYVGCKSNAGQNYFSTLTQIVDRFTLEAERLDINAVYDSIGGNEGVQFNVNNHKTLFVGTDTYWEHYDKDTFQVLVSWYRLTPAASFAIQLDFGSANDPLPTTTTDSGPLSGNLAAVGLVVAACLLT